MARKADIGLIGLAVMGQNLVLNMSDKGYTVAVFNRTASVTEEFLRGPANGRISIIGAKSIEELVHSLSVPRKIMLMVKAGEAVDALIAQMLPLLSKGDLIIDGGNSRFEDTGRRTSDLEKRGILYIGTGVSGGEEGARTGPSLMPGGNVAAWPLVRDLFRAISAKTDEGEPCCDWVGPAGAGHYVKMIHNGIEYGDMQLICEAYHVLREGLGLEAEAAAGVFAAWNEGALKSYLIEITARILAFKDSDGTPLVDKILDTAGQKGTGKWTGINSLELGIPITVISEAVYARCLSALKDERTKASRLLPAHKAVFEGDSRLFVADMEKALLASKLISYAQGFMLMREASKEYGWGLNFGDIALMWRGGCIIRSVFLGKIKEAFAKNPDLSNLLLDDHFRKVMLDCEPSWRWVVAKSVELGIPVPAFSSAISFYDGYRSERLPANLLQAQRDFFGAHTYERTDRPRGEFFHTEWNTQQT